MTISPEMTRSLTDKANATLPQAAAKVIERAKQTGTPVIVLENGQVKELAPQQVAQRMIALPARDGEGHEALDGSRLRCTVRRLSGVHAMNLLLDTHTFLWFWWDDIPIVSVDEQLDAYGVDRIW